jgi:hypothetical protein
MRSSCSRWIDSNELLSEEQALDVVSGWKRKKPAESASESGASDLSQYEKQVCSIFTAVKRAAGRVPEEARSAVLMEALQYYFHYCSGAGEPITIEPAAAEDDWVLQPNANLHTSSIAA